MLPNLRKYWIALTFLAGTAAAQDVTIGFSLSIPPYVFTSEHRGIEVDIAREALAFKGHRLLPQYFPQERLHLAFRYGRIDGTMKDLGEDLTQYGGHYAEPAVFYNNVFISLKNKQLRITTPEDLESQIVVSYIGAQQHHQNWLVLPQMDGLYFETSNQELQVQGLYRGHFDIMLTDRYIFHYYAQKLARENKLELTPVTEQNFTTVNLNDFRPVFRNPKIRDDFNAGLQHLKESGRFDAIYNYYLEEGSNE